MKKIVVLLLVGLMVMAGSVMAFAEETPAELGERPIREERSPEEKRAKVEELFSLYNPDGLEAFNQITEEHKSFHEMAKSIRESFKSDLQTQRQAIRTQLENGEITQEEVQAMKETAKAERQVFKEEAMAIKASKQAEVQAIKEEHKALRTSLKEALKAEVVDQGLVASLLDQMVELLEDHVEVDYKYFEMMQSLRDSEEI